MPSLSTFSIRKEVKQLKKAQRKFDKSSNYRLEDYKSEIKKKFFFFLLNLLAFLPIETEFYINNKSEMFK